MSRRDRWSGRSRARGRREVTDLRSARIAGTAGTAEGDMQLAVEQALGYGGWMYHHDLHATLGSGTFAVSHSGQAGWPDIVAVHPGRHQLLVLELKATTGRYRPGQAEWLDAWRAAGADVRTVRPEDLHALKDELIGDRIVRTGR